MIYQKLELHIARIEKSISISRSDYTGHPKKQEIYNNLIALFSAIKRSDYRSFDDDNLCNTKSILDLIFDEIQYLHFTNEEDIPKKLIYCLNNVLNDWIPNGTDHFHIVIDHNNSLTNFYFQYLTEEDINQVDLWVTGFFGIGFKSCLVRISKPKILFDDFLGSTPVYHELGHFIDNNYQIIESLMKDPALAGKNIAHYQEFFADVFAAQYIGKSSIEPLNYNSPETRQVASPTHPTNELRIKVVNAFLEGTGGAEELEIVAQLKLAVTNRGCGELKTRNMELHEDPFVTHTAVILDDPSRVHTLFLKGWEHWVTSTSPIRATYTDPVECCNKLNDLIKDSIGGTMTALVPAH